MLDVELILRLLGGLGLVLGLLVVFMKKGLPLLAGQLPSHERFLISATTALGHGRALHVVKLRNHEWVVATSPQGVHLICELPPATLEYKE
jgi:hypothetical protein